MNYRFQIFGDKIKLVGSKILSQLLESLLTSNLGQIINPDVQPQLLHIITRNKSPE